jgi:hypothetical protein
VGLLVLTHPRLYYTALFLELAHLLLDDPSSLHNYPSDMPTYWNSRKLLAVDPTKDTCAGITQKGSKCTKPLNQQKRAQARMLLDAMDKQSKVSSKQFQQLAGELLCKEVHNSVRRPHLSQVEEVGDDWHAIYEEYMERSKLKRTQSTARQSPAVQSAREKSKPMKSTSYGIKNEVKVCNHKAPFREPEY